VIWSGVIGDGMLFVGGGNWHQEGWVVCTLLFVVFGGCEQLTGVAES
jgi:hypothetical protein